MIQSCPTCPLKFNDATVKACPKCEPPSHVRSSVHSELKNVCASCRALFNNDLKWWRCYGNYCPQCVRDKLNPKATALKAPVRRVAVGKAEQLFVERYDKFPSGMELEDFKTGLRAAGRARAMDKEKEE